MIANPSPTLCEACTQLGIMTQATEPHNALLDRGSRQPSPDGSFKQMFRCSQCNTIWLRHIDKWGMTGTFHLASNTSILK